METFKSILSILGDIGQLAFELVAILLSIYALTTKRSDVFKTELAKKQFEEIGLIRRTLNTIYYDLYYVQQFKGMIDVSGGGLPQFEKDCPNEWEQYQRYKSNSISIFYKLMLTTYYLLPTWISKEKIQDFHNEMRKFAPFTISSTGNRTSEELENYSNRIVEMIKYLDEELTKNA